MFNQETASSITAAVIVSAREVDGFKFSLLFNIEMHDKDEGGHLDPDYVAAGGQRAKSRHWHSVFAWACERGWKQLLLEMGKGVAKLKVTCVSVVPPLVSGTRSYQIDAHFLLQWRLTSRARALCTHQYYCTLILSCRFGCGQNE
jgi:hypothetical protein